MWKEFKEFALKGNVIDLAVGVIIGGAFSKIVASLVSDLIMPLIGLVTGGLDFSGLFVPLGQVPAGVVIKTAQEAKDLGIATFSYGAFITQVIDFIIMAAVIFFFIKGMSRLSEMGKRRKPVPAAAPASKKCPYCLTDIDIKATRCPHCTSHLT